MSRRYLARRELTRTLVASILRWTYHDATNQTPRFPDAHIAGCDLFRDDDPLCVRQRGRFRAFYRFSAYRCMRAAAARCRFRFPGSPDSVHEPPLLPETEL